MWSLETSVPSAPATNRVRLGVPEWPSARPPDNAAGRCGAMRAVRESLMRISSSRSASACPQPFGLSLQPHATVTAERHLASSSPEESGFACRFMARHRTLRGFCSRSRKRHPNKPTCCSWRKPKRKIRWPTSQAALALMLSGSRCG